MIMADNIITRLSQWGVSSKETTNGTAIDAAIGVPVLNNAAFDPGQEFVEDRKATGKTVIGTGEIVSNTVNPSWAPETTMFFPEFGEWVALLCQKAVESGVGPYVQTIEPDQSNGKDLVYGSAGALENYAITLWQKIGQTTNRDIAMAGAIVSRIDVTIPESGRVTVTPHFMALGYDDGDDASGGTFTLPATTIEKMSRDFVFKLGDGTPASLHSREVSFSLIADVVTRRYGGLNDAFPYKFLYNGWSLEGSFSKPVLATTDTLAKDFFVEGGDTGLDQLFYVYSKTMADYSEAAASLSNGEMRFTFNIKIDTVTLGGDDETIEEVTFKGVEDGTNNIFKFEQCTTASQAWAS
jgi:hypothetical protein